LASLQLGFAVDTTYSDCSGVRASLVGTRSETCREKSRHTCRSVRSAVPTRGGHVGRSRDTTRSRVSTGRRQRDVRRPTRCVGRTAVATDIRVQLQQACWTSLQSVRDLRGLRVICNQRYAMQPTTARLCCCRMRCPMDRQTDGRTDRRTQHCFNRAYA